MSRTRIAILFAAGATAAVAATAVVATGRGGTGQHEPVPAASVMRALHEPPTQASAVPPEIAASLAMVPDVETDDARRLISGIGSKGYSVYVAPTAGGSVCVSTPAGGGCFPSFPDAGITTSVGMNNDGRASPTDRELIAGVARDDVAKIVVAAGTRRLPVPLRNGGFVYESPVVGLWADALLVKLADGSTARVPIANANRFEAIP
jgi:hypothetical protein